MNDYYAGEVYEDEVGFNPFKAVGKAAAGTVRSVKRVVKKPGKALGSLAKGVLSGPAGILRSVGVPPVITTAIDPAGTIMGAAAKGAEAGLKKGGFSGFLKGAGKGALKGGKAVTSNPIIRGTAAGLTFVMPPAGLALSGGLLALDKGIAATQTAVKGIETAEKLVSAFEHGTPEVKKVVGNIYARTANLAKAGDVDAKRALVVLASSKAKLDAMKAHTYFVTPAGRITRGKFSKVSSGGSVGFYVRADGRVERGMFRAG
jgi:hypothetical protein